jgi:hypothetical protein
LLYVLPNNHCRICVHITNASQEIQSQCREKVMLSCIAVADDHFLKDTIVGKGMDIYQRRSHVEKFLKGGFDIVVLAAL